MDRTERFYRIRRLLTAGSPVAFTRMQADLGVSRAQLKRDLAYLRDRLNAPIEYDREANGYRMGAPLAGPRFELPGLWFSAAEIHALLTMQHLLENLQPGLLSPHVKPLLARFAAILGEGAHSGEAVADRVRVLHQASRALKEEHFAVVAHATLKRRQLRIEHWSRGEDRVTTRTVSPQRLVHYRDNWYLDAWCHLRKAPRSFAVDAMRDAEPLDARAKDLPKATLDRLLTSGYGIFGGARVQWAQLRFSPFAARWVSAQSWHPEQEARVEADGSYLLSIPYADDRELVMDILQHGADVEVLAPPVLRERVAQRLREAAARYR